jgi:hypothetical protein
MAALAPSGCFVIPGKLQQTPVASVPAAPGLIRWFVLFRPQLETAVQHSVDRAPAAVAKAVADATARAQTDASAREELLKREFAGEKNVLTTRIESLEQTVKERAAQILKFSQQAEKAYMQVQDIAVKAIEGSANFKSLASLQQLLTEQGRKQGQEK